MYKLDFVYILETQIFLTLFLKKKSLDKKHRNENLTLLRVSVSRNDFFYITETHPIRHQQKN